MQEVLNKINELVSLLEDKNKATESLNRQLSEKKAQLEILEGKAVAKLNHVSAMERIYKKYEEFDKVQTEFAVKAKETEDRLKLARELEGNDAKALAKIKEESAVLDARKISLNKQADALDKEKAEIAKARAELKAIINGDSIKGILK